MTPPPVITCPADVNLDCTDPTDPGDTGEATATDDCDTSVTITYTDNVIAGSCPQANTTIERTWTATDDCGNVSTCLQIIDVADDTPPVITCPADVNLECTDIYGSKQILEKPRQRMIVIRPLTISIYG